MRLSGSGPLFAWRGHDNTSMVKESSSDATGLRKVKNVNFEVDIYIRIAYTYM